MGSVTHIQVTVEVAYRDITVNLVELNVHLDSMVMIAVTNAVQTVTLPVDVTDLQESVMEGVNQDGQGSFVIRCASQATMVKTAVINAV